MSRALSHDRKKAVELITEKNKWCKWLQEVEARAKGGEEFGPGVLDALRNHVDTLVREAERVKLEVKAREEECRRMSLDSLLKTIPPENRDSALKILHEHQEALAHLMENEQVLGPMRDTVNECGRNCSEIFSISQFLIQQEELDHLRTQLHAILEVLGAVMRDLSLRRQRIAEGFLEERQRKLDELR